MVPRAHSDVGLTSPDDRLTPSAGHELAVRTLQHLVVEQILVTFWTFSSDPESFTKVPGGYKLFFFSFEPLPPLVLEPSDLGFGSGVCSKALNYLVLL